MAGCTHRNRRKQISKWERESMFRASSDVKERLSISLCVCACGTPHVCVWLDYHVNSNSNLRLGLCTLLLYVADLTVGPDTAV